MLSREPTPDEMRQALSQMLAHPERGIPSDTGLDEETIVAVKQVWKHQAARGVAYAALAAQLDGTHERERAARIDAVIEASRARQGS